MNATLFSFIVFTATMIIICALFVKSSDCSSGSGTDNLNECIRESRRNCEMNYPKQFDIITANDFLTTRCCPKQKLRDCLKKECKECPEKTWYYFMLHMPKCITVDIGNTTNTAATAVHRTPYSVYLFVTIITTTTTTLFVLLVY